jgi:hypothetical protein
MANEIAKHREGLFVAFGCIFVIGIFLRLPPPAFGANSPLHVLAVLHAAPGFNGTGFDEGLYRHYINALSEGGITAYPNLVEGYMQIQKKLPGSILPPTRFLFIFTGYIWHSIFGCETLAGLRQITSLFSCLTLILATLFAWRLGGIKMGARRGRVNGVRAHANSHVAARARGRLLYILGFALPLVAMGKSAQTARLASAR